MNSILGTGLFPCGNTFGFPSATLFFAIMLPLFIIIMLFVMPRKKEENFDKWAYLLTVIYLIPLIISYFIPDPYTFALSNPDANYFGYGEITGHYPSTFYLTGGKADLGIIIYFLLFFFVPLLFLYWGYRGMPISTEGKRDEKNIINLQEKVNRNKKNT